MAKFNINLLEDVDRLFKERSIDDIIEIEKLLDGEIENKRVDLRSMVGDRYKDVLTASDAIKSMKSLSETIVDNIQKITNRSTNLIDEATIDNQQVTSRLDQGNQENYIFAIQIRLTMCINEQIWMAIDKEDYSKAAQLYLLAQHIHTGLRLLKDDMLERLPIIRRVKATVESLRSRILEKIHHKLQTLEISAQETSSNLTALMLLENETSLDLLKFFMHIRKTALVTVIGTPHPSVRVQMSTMVRCLITTVHLLHDCFLCYENSNRGLIWQELESIVGENAPRTLSKVLLPITPLNSYISDIIKQFRPKCTNVNSILLTSDVETVIEDWLTSTTAIIKQGLEASLELVVNIKGLHIIREEALKTDIPADWDKMCSKANLPLSFDIWYYFFQNLVSKRAQFLISKKSLTIINDLEKEIVEGISNSIKTDHLDSSLKIYTWTEDPSDVSRTENKHLGLSMKTKGFSPTIVNLCQKLDNKYAEFLQDISIYLYGKELNLNSFDVNFVLKDKLEKKFVDRDKLEHHLILECKQNADKFTTFLENFLKSEKDPNLLVAKSLICARFLLALMVLCPHYHKCCVCSSNSDEWDKICSIYNKYSLQFWQQWVDNSVVKTSNDSEVLRTIDSIKLISILPRWDLIDIQEQTEEKVFKSQIKVPYQCSLSLQQILTNLNNNVNSILPHTMPKQVHLQFIEKNIEVILNSYELILSTNINQSQALQFLFDIKFITLFAIPRENIILIQKSQEICDKLRSKVDPFDLDVFYSYLQHNVKQSVLQSQILLGCLLPSSSQLASLGLLEKNKEHDKEPSVLAMSNPVTSTWFPLLPVTAPVQKTATVSIQSKDSSKTSSPNPQKANTKKSTRSGAASLFGAMATDWFS